jgi:hypothetical protein
LQFSELVDSPESSKRGLQFVVGLHHKDLDLVYEINIYKKRAKGGEIGSEKEEWRVGNNVEIREATTGDPTNESVELHYHFFYFKHLLYGTISPLLLFFL